MNWVAYESHQHTLEEFGQWAGMCEGGMSITRQGWRQVKSLINGDVVKPEPFGYCEVTLPLLDGQNHFLVRDTIGTQVPIQVPTSETWVYVYGWVRNQETFDWGWTPPRPRVGRDPWDGGNWWFVVKTPYHYHIETFPNQPEALEGALKWVNRRHPDV